MEDVLIKAHKYDALTEVIRDLRAESDHLPVRHADRVTLREMADRLIAERDERFA